MTRKKKEVLMKSSRVLKLILTAALIVAVLVVLQTFNSSGSATKSDPAAVGMGDLHRFEYQSSSQYSGTPDGSRSDIGMGDLHRYEAQGFIPGANLKVNSGSYAGMGDLHRFEATQKTQGPD
jgi:hypothetical protein